MESPAPPLLMLQLPFLRALDPRSGRLLWETVVGEPDGSSAPGRFFLTRHGLVVMAAARMWLVDVATGRLAYGVELPFAPDTAIFDGECFYVAAVHKGAAVALDGRLRWRFEPEAGWTGARLVCRDAEGQVLWEQKAPPAAALGATAGIALGALVAQPDDKGMS